MRSWLRTPRLTLALLATIAVSIGGTATVLTFVHAILLRPPPFPTPDRLVMIVPRDTGNAGRAYLSYPNFADIRAAARSFELLEGGTVSRLVVQTAGGSERLRGETVTPGYFDLLGFTPALGRTFTADEYAGRGPRAILLSHRVWRTRFAADPALIGQPVSTRVGPAVVVGVMSEPNRGLGEDEGTDYWFAEKQNNHPDMLTDRAYPTTLVAGRLKPHVTLAQADAELQSLLAALPPASSSSQISNSSSQIAAPPQARLEPLAEKWRASLRGGLVTMLVGSGFLLLIGCGNVALLLLARLVDRERELALRLSLGASRAQLVRLMLRESLSFAVVGGGLGILLAAWLVELFVRTSGIALPAHMPVALTAAPLVLCAVVVLATGLGFGLLPAFAATRVNAALALRAGGRGLATSALRGRTGRTLIVAQTALAVALLAVAALFVRSYDKLRSANFGYRTDSLLRYQVSLQRESYRTPESLESFHRALGVDLAALPGVQRVGLMAPTVPPYDGQEASIRLKGADLATPDNTLAVRLRYSDRAALDLLRLPLRSGRFFSADDHRGQPAVALVSETLARRLAPDGAALGRTLLVPPNHTEAVIIGVVGDALWEGRRNRQPTRLDVLLSIDQFPQLSTGLVFATTVDPRSLIDPVRKTIVPRDTTAALHWITTMEQALDEQTVHERFWTVLATAYAGTALLLAVIGLYGVLSHSVARRRQEMGVRLALGATATALARLVIGQGLRLVFLGIFTGLALALLAGRALESRLFGISAHDPLALLASAALLAVIALLACWLPARKAARTDPMIALRSE